MSQDISKMETAKDILRKHAEFDMDFSESWVLKAMEEYGNICADKAWEASQAWKRFGKTNIYPDKSTFMKSLFPLKEI